MIFRFNGMDFGIMPININTHFSYMFVCVGRGERGCGIFLHAADWQTRKTLVNDSFLRSMKATMKLILRKDLCALREYSRMGFTGWKNGCLERLFPGEWPGYKTSKNVYVSEVATFTTKFYFYFKLNSFYVDMNFQKWGKGKRINRKIPHPGGGT